MCSDTLSRLGGNARYLLVSSADECGEYWHYSHLDDAGRIELETIPSDEACVFRVRNDAATESNTIQFSPIIMSDVEAFVYEHDGELEFIDRGELHANERSSEFEIHPGKYAYIVVSPNQPSVTNGLFGTDFVSIPIENPTDDPDEGLSLIAILGISLGSVVLLICLITL